MRDRGGDHGDSERGSRGLTRGWPAILAAGVLGLAVRCAVLWQISDAPFFELRLGDGEAYHAWARRLASGDWLGSEVFYQAPLYPYFLAVVYRLIGDGAATVRVLHAVLGGVSCGLLSWAGWRMFGRRGVLAGVALAVYPPAVFLDVSLDKTALATALLCAMLAAFARRQWLWAGVAAGLLGLTRENALLLGLVLLWAAGRKGWAVAAGCSLVLIPVGLRNLAVGGEFAITTAQAGPNFYIGNHAGAPGWYEPLVTGHGSAVDERADATRLAEQSAGRKLGAGEVSRYWTGRALEFVRSRPLEWLGLMAKKLALTVNHAEIADTESQQVYAEWSWILRAPIGFGLVLAAAALRWRGDRRLWAMACVYALGVAAFYVVARYRFPLVPILMLLAVSLPWPPPRATIAGAMGVLAITLVPLVDTRTGRATNYYAIATGLSRDPARLDDAASFFRRAIEVDGRFAGARFGLATVLTRQGRPAEAIPHYEAAVAGWPDHEEARYNFGQALAAAGRPAEAVAQYEAALRLRPDDAEAHTAMGHALVSLGRAREAIAHFATAVELTPGVASAHGNLGAALANGGRVAEAVPHFERAAELDPGNENARRNLEAAREIVRLR
jgi:tetratricopeptide (TPR) repeat protein